MLKELVELQMNAPTDYVAQHLRNILKGFLNNTLDLEKAITFIGINIEKSNSIMNKVFWFNVINIIKSYHKKIIKLK